jgi:hypothetical protein
VNQESELCAKGLLNLGGDLLIRGCVQTATGDFGSEPVGLAQADSKGDEIFFDLLRGEVQTDLIE